MLSEGSWESWVARSRLSDRWDTESCLPKEKSAKLGYFLREENSPVARAQTVHGFRSAWFESSCSPATSGQFPRRSTGSFFVWNPKLRSVLSCAGSCWELQESARMLNKWQPFACTGPHLLKSQIQENQNQKGFANSFGNKIKVIWQSKPIWADTSLFLFFIYPTKCEYS